MSNKNHKTKISFLDRLYQLLPNTQQYHPLLCNDPVLRDNEQRKRRRNIRDKLGKSRSGVQWGPTHSYDSDDVDDDDVVAVVGRDNNVARGDGTGEKRLAFGDGGTTTTTQTCNSSKEMSSQGFKSSSSKVALSTVVPHQQQSAPPSTAPAASLAPAPTTSANTINNHTVTHTAPLDRTQERIEDFSVTAIPAASCNGTLDRIWNQAFQFARDYIDSPENGVCHCHPCKVREDYVTVHTVSTTHRHKKGGGNAKRSGHSKKRQGTSRQHNHPIEALGQIDIHIEDVSIDDSSLTSNWVGKDFPRIEQRNQQQQQETLKRSVKTKTSIVTPTKHSINTALKENQDPKLIKQETTTPATSTSTILRSQATTPSTEPHSRGKSFKFSPRRIKSTRAHRRVKSTPSASSQIEQQDWQQHKKHEPQQHNTPKSTDAHKQQQQQQHEQQQHITPITTAAHKQQPQQPQQIATSAVHKLPFDTIHFSLSQTISLKESISELTMRSSHTEALAKHDQQHQYPSSDHRRMAYYAVGQEGAITGKNDNRPCSNRRCYFSGRLIHGGRPFYAGSVQQGLRTLVVFCLPRTLHLPQRCQLEALLSSVPVENRVESGPDDCAGDKGRTNLTDSSIAIGGGGGGATNTYARSYNTTADSCDNNGNNNNDRMADEVDHLLDRGILRPEQVLDILPHPGVGNGVDLLSQMKKRYPDQFATLPPQVRLGKCWRLYFKFCFFSGLPIADGEMYYKVTDKIMDRLRSRSQSRSLSRGRVKVLSSNENCNAGSPSRKSKRAGGGDDLAGVEEIILSHEIMEAVNGEQSAEILRLPNKKTFRYLQKQYTQQCAKLGGKVFDRTSWQRVMPEV